MLVGGRLEFLMYEAWEFLMDEQAGPVSICGAGGIGKTTLMRQLYNKLVATRNFEYVIWITVSSTSTLERIHDTISKSIGIFDAKWVDSSFIERSELVQNKLSGKKFALFLDDVWKQFDLSELGVPSFAWCTENKLVFTTRSWTVARSMFAQLTLEMDILSTEDAWQLFRNKVGNNDILTDPSILKLSEILVSKCQGLPIFLCTVGRAMASRKTKKEWSDALVELLRLEVKDSPENSLLQFCFDSLPNHRIKSCLMFFSLFPEDFTILKNDLIDFWICEQLLDEYDSRDDDTLYLGYNAIHTLIGAGLLEQEHDDYVKLLDMIRDFASLEAVKYRKYKNAQLTEATPGKLVTHVGWPSIIGEFLKKTATISDNLLTFLFHHNPFIMIKDQLIQQSKISPLMPVEVGNFSKLVNVITVLDLSYSGVEEVPQEISSLVSLLYLNLSHTWIERLPVKLKTLTKLKCLKLEYNDQLRVIPKQLISSLSSLRVLKIFRCGYSVEELEDNILLATNMDVEPFLCLEHLKVLSITITSAHALHKLCSNPTFLSCIQSLSLEIFWGSKSFDISRLTAMKNLLALEIHQAEVLENLNGDLQFPKLLSERSFERLEKISIGHCSNLRELTWVILAPNLKILRVENCEKMAEIISIAQLGANLERRKDVEPFEKLEILTLVSLPKLRNIYWKALPFRYLKKIEIIDCSLLRRLPLNSNSADSKSKEVVIEAEEDWWKDVEWEDDATKTTFLPCFRQSFLM